MLHYISSILEYLNTVEVWALIIIIIYFFCTAVPREKKEKKREREKAKSMSQQFEDDTERRSAVSNTRFHDNSRWQGPRPHGLPVMNHLPWRWDNTHKCTHMRMQRLTHRRVARQTDMHAHRHTALFCSHARLAFRERLKTHTLVYIKRIVFQPPPVERKKKWIVCSVIRAVNTPLLINDLSADYWFSSHTWNLCAYVCMHVCVSMHARVCILSCNPATHTGMLVCVCERNVWYICSR